jgi:hypothetical protein
VKPAPTVIRTEVDAVIRDVSVTVKLFACIRFNRSFWLRKLARIRRAGFLVVDKGGDRPAIIVRGKIVKLGKVEK